MSLWEGLTLSVLPCTKVLSVAGFYAFTEPFPGREGFILRERGGLFAPHCPSLLQPGKQKCTYGGTTGGICRGVHSGREACTGWDTPTYTHREAYTGWSIPFHTRPVRELGSVITLLSLYCVSHTFSHDSPEQGLGFTPIFLINSETEPNPRTGR